VPLTAWCFRAIVFGLAAASAAWAWWWLVRGAVATAVVGALAILFVHVPILAVEFVVLFVSTRRQRDAALRPTLRETVAAWAAESVVLLRPFMWDMPMWRAAEPDRPQPASVGAGAAPRRGVVLVHGFFCNRALWNPWMRRLHAHGVPHVAVDLDPPLRDLDVHAAAIGDAVERLRRATGRAPVIVCHSMGGVAARAWLRAQPADAVHAVVTVASPHAGSRAARWLHLLLPVEVLAQLRPGSDWLRALAAGETPGRRARFVCASAACDNVVLPASSALLEGADNLVVPACAHTQLLGHDDVWRALLVLAGAPVKGRTSFRAADPGCG
jgi:hypothetical protein